ncbi:MAG: FAD-dependent oxidoreductase [Firmicutes bacterium]|nr:FAD-dependent oxidoreductase [Bacillota bacterium]
MARVVVVGGGWAGCAAAYAASRAGAETQLLERTDMLLGTGLVGGIMRNNGRLTAAEELIFMGGGELIKACDRAARHTNVDFPGHKHASLYDITRVLREVERALQAAGVTVEYQTRVSKVSVDNGKILKVKSSDGREFAGDVFIDATGSAGPVKSCKARGRGCVMCIIRCPAFGGRVSLCEEAGIEEFAAVQPDGTEGAVSGSCKLLKDSLSRDIVERLDRKGIAVVPIPKDLITEGSLGRKVCQQYGTEDYMNNIVLLDTGHAKMMAPWFPLEKLRKIPGFERVRYEDPYAGGKGNSVRMTAMVIREDTMQVSSGKNLFCAGEKAGPLVGHTEAILTGTLAGHNAVRYVLSMPLLRLDEETASGDFIKYTGDRIKDKEGRNEKYTFSGAQYFERMKQKGLYTASLETIGKRVGKGGLTGIFAKKLL